MTHPPCIIQAMWSVHVGKSADVKRCHQLRAAFPLLDFDDEESSADLRQLLLRAAFCPAFLRLAEGRRFLSGLFNLQVPCLHPEVACAWEVVHIVGVALSRSTHVCD